MEREKLLRNMEIVSAKPLPSWIRDGIYSQECLESCYRLLAAGILEFDAAGAFVLCEGNTVIALLRHGSDLVELFPDRLEMELRLKPLPPAARAPLRRLGPVAAPAPAKPVGIAPELIRCERCYIPIEGHPFRVRSHEDHNESEDVCFDCYSKDL